VNANALAVMLKAPAPGAVKTRMVPPLTPEQAAGLYECLVKDTLASLVPLKGVDIYAACLGSISSVAALVPEGVEAFEQGGEGLGERMLDVLKKLFERGYARCAVVGSDLPDLPAQYVLDAFALIEGGENFVLGPAEDGGYYLAAADAPYEPVFTSIRYSTPTVLERTLERAEENSIKTALVSPWHDIDTIEDLRLLRSNLRAPLSSAYIASLDIPL